MFTIAHLSIAIQGEKLSKPGWVVLGALQALAQKSIL